MYMKCEVRQPWNACVYMYKDFNTGVEKQEVGKVRIKNVKSNMRVAVLFVAVCCRIHLWWK